MVPLLGSTTTVVPLLGSTTTVVPLLGSTTTVAPLLGSTTTVAPLLGSTTTVVPLLGSTRTVAPLLGSTTTVLPLTISPLPQRDYKFKMDSLRSYTNLRRVTHGICALTSIQNTNVIVLLIKCKHKNAIYAIEIETFLGKHLEFTK